MKDSKSFCNVEKYSCESRFPFIWDTLYLGLDPLALCNHPVCGESMQHTTHIRKKSLECHFCNKKFSVPFILLLFFIIDLGIIFFYSPERSTCSKTLILSIFLGRPLGRNAK